VVSTLPEGELLSTLLTELHEIAEEDARFIAEGKPLPVGLSEREGVLT
jgi:hypothetical protein